jgi:N-ethylmaleimide reductase
MAKSGCWKASGSRAQWLSWSFPALNKRKPGIARRVQIQANYLYLIAQFLNSATNHRTDKYGGSTENRGTLSVRDHGRRTGARRAFRVGVEIGPIHLTGPFVVNEDTLPDMQYVFRKLDSYGLAHLLLMGRTPTYPAV